MLGGCLYWSHEGGWTRGAGELPGASDGQPSTSRLCCKGCEFYYRVCRGTGLGGSRRGLRFGTGRASRIRQHPFPRTWCSFQGWLRRWWWGSCVFWPSLRTSLRMLSRGQRARNCKYEGGSNPGWCGCSVAGCMKSMMCCEADGPVLPSSFSQFRIQGLQFNSFSELIASLI